MPGNLAYRAYRLIWEALDWLYPPNCGGCGQSGARWCKECSQNTLEIETPICPICGNVNINERPCQRCQDLPGLFIHPFAPILYLTDPSERQFINLKYRRNIGLGEALSRPMITSLQKLNWSLDIITSVPLGLVRLEERGYNQATLLARPIALCLKIPSLHEHC